MREIGGAKPSFLSELRRRRVPSVLLAYVLVAWGVIEVSDVVFPAFGFPDWTQRLVIVLAALGVPIAVVLAWAYDLTVDGPVRTPDPVDAGPAVEPPGRAIDRDRWHRVQEAFLDALEAPAGERGRRLAVLEAEDPAVSQEVAGLLEAHAAPGPVDDVMDWLHAPGREPEPGTVVGGYTLEERLGAGGMGVVYRAVDERLERAVALKFLAPAVAGDASAKERFVLEARAAAALDHPNICTILEIGETAEGQVFIAMPFYDGDTLKSRIRRGPLPVGEALDLAAQIGRGLAAAHQRGIVHRDIKPANVILTGDGTAKVVDFGIAKVADAALTRTGAALGTIRYMSPEQARGEAVDHRTDLWSLGVLLYEMLTGTHPFPGADEQAVRSAILGAPHTPLEQERPEIPDPVSAIIDRALLKERDDRYGSAAELLTDLEAAGSGVEGTGPPATGAMLPAGERRICTVMVASVAEYDRLLEELSPDELGTLTQRLGTVVAEAVSAAGGRLIRSEDRQFEAAFGIPMTREDDARRAVRAALTVRERIERLAAESNPVLRSLAVGIGIDAGGVAVRRREDRGGGYRVSGRPVRAAAELARRAAPGEILVTDDCRRLAGTLETGGTTEIDVAGEEAPVPAYVVEAEGPEPTAFEHWTGQGLTEFLGRTEELESLARAAATALDGRGALVEVVGEPGVGKSRLLYEFSRTIRGDSARVLTGRCQSVTRATSYGPIAQVLREYLSAPDRPAGELTAAEAVAGLLDVDATLDDTLPLVLQLLGLSHPEHPLPRHLKGDQLRVAVVEAVAGLFSVIAAERPLVLLFEDWHWADEASTLTLLQVAQLAPSFPILVAVTYRPGYGVDLRSAPDLVSIRLGPIGEATVAGLLRSVMGAETVDAELTRAVAERTGGNPFFIEEVAADLREQGVITVRSGVAALSDPGRVRLPDTVQAAIRTRLDRVDPASRWVLCVGSVIGREFSRDLVGSVLEAPASLDPGLETLKAAGLIQQTRVIPAAHYRFKHALTQEVTYESLLAHQRRELHREVGERLEAGDGQSDEDLDVLAHHFGEAGVWRKAVRYGLGSARRLMDLSENEEALALLGRVERWAEHDADDPEGRERLREVLLTKERLLDATGDRPAQRLAINRIRELADGASPRERLEVELREADLSGALGDYEAARTRLLRVLDHSQEVGDHTMQRRALQSLGLLYWHQERPEEALPLLEEAVELDRHHGDVEGELGDLFNIMTVLRGMGEYERAVEVGREIETLATPDRPFHLGLALHGIAQSYRLMGRPRDAIEFFGRAAEIFAATRLFQQSSYATTSLASVHFQLGELDGSLDLYQQAIDDARRARHGEGLAVALEGKAKVLEAAGRAAEAVPLLEEADPILEQLEDDQGRIGVVSRLATLHAQLGQPQEALTAWGTVRQIARRREDAALEVVALEGLATASRQHFGQGDLAIPLYEEGVAKALELGDHGTAGRLLNSLGVIAWERNDWSRARTHYSEALKTFRTGEDREGIALTLASLGAVHQRLGEPDEALAALEESIATSRGEDGHPRLLGYALGLLGDTHRDQGQLDRAEEAYRESLELRERLSDLRGEGWMLLKLAEVEEARGALDRVRELSSRAYQIATEVGDEALMQACTAQERY